MPFLQCTFELGCWPSNSFHLDYRDIVWGCTGMSAMSCLRDGINTVGILRLSSIVFRQHKNKEEILTTMLWCRAGAAMVVVTLNLEPIPPLD